jgi:hypothetical protein
MIKMAWGQYIDNRYFCRSCHKTANSKPDINCSETRHIEFYKDNLGRDKQSRLKNKAVWKIRYHEQENKIRKDVMNHYGGKCVCPDCGFDDLDFKLFNKSFLQMDHINGGGSKDRLITGSGSKFYRWIKRNNYPPGFRVLCGACNPSMKPGEIICEYHKWLRRKKDFASNSDY